ncbi:MAG: helix-turn-helix domain-containing protein [Gemmataceae bacterium]|nr:helix-turn-helix domain-containing protein [Gemmataceae bacterium]
MAKGKHHEIVPRPTQGAKTPEAAKEAHLGGRIEIFVNGVRVEVSPELEAAVERAHKGLLQPHAAEMTTTQAAEFLDVSRPFVIKLVRRGELPCRMVGKHRRIPTEALRDYKAKMFREAKSAADELTQMSQELGLYDLEGPPPKKP